jgi:aconitate hydratase
MLLGVRAALVESFERIHRSNLIGMGVLPLMFKPGQNAESLGLTGKERISIQGISGTLTPRQDVTVEVERPDGTKSSFATTLRIDTPVEISYYTNGGILQTVLRKMLTGC